MAAKKPPVPCPVPECKGFLRVKTRPVCFVCSLRAGVKPGPKVDAETIVQAACRAREEAQAHATRRVPGKFIEGEQIREPVKPRKGRVPTVPRQEVYNSTLDQWQVV